METTAAAMRAKYKVLSAHLDERSLRLCAAGDAKMFGYGGVSFVAEAAGLSRTTLYSGSAEVTTEPRPDGGRIRKPGGDQPALFSQRKRATASRSWFGSTPPFDQFSFQRNERPQYWPSEQGDVLRKQQGTEREHPESQHRKETENSEDDQQ